MKDDLLHEKVTLLVDFINKSDKELREMNIYETLKHLHEVQEHNEKFGLKLKSINHQKLLDVIVLLELAERNYENIERWGLPPLQCFPVNTTTHFNAISIYQSHKHELIQLCKNNLYGNWSLSCCLWGHFEENAKPAVIVFYQEKLSSWVDPVIECLMFISFESPIELYSGVPSFQASVNSGACIGTKIKIGTFGGYVQDETGNIFGLTCGHVQSHDGEWVDVEQPSTAAIMSLLNDKEIDEEDKKPFAEIENTLFGKVVVGEENYIENEKCCRFDWVLFEPVQARLGSNLISCNKLNTRLFDDIKVSSCEIEDKVWKQGYQTEFTTGRINGVEAMILSDGKLSTEWVIIGNSFSLPGDSGSWIANKNGVCGVVFAGCEGKGWTFFTKFDDLLTRIYTKTGYHLIPVKFQHF